LEKNEGKNGLDLPCIITTASVVRNSGKPSKLISGQEVFRKE
jgi:hypothetical protein